VILNSQVFTVVGILPSDFLLARSNTELWVPLPFDQQNVSSPLRLISRLKPGVSLERARSDMNLITRHLKQHLEGKSLEDSTSDEASKYEWRSDGKHPQPAWKGGWIIDFFPLNYRVGDYWERALYMLQGAAIFVLLIGCANVANLLLARGAARQNEIATRVAL
jgi:hypothetical protein